MKKVFLENLPRKGDKIDWKNSVGSEVNFIYDDIKGIIKIIKYANYYLTLKYNDRVKELSPNHFKNGNIGNVIGVNSNDYYHKKGEIVEKVTSGRLKIVNQTRIKSRKYYEYECLICGNVDGILENNLRAGNGCNVCSIPSKKVLVGYNDINTTNIELANLLWDKDDALKYTENSHVKVDFKCPDCGVKIKNKSITKVNNNNLSCKSCGDGVSYPEKIMFSLLDHLNLKFDTQMVFKWSTNIESETKELCGNKKYDFYIPSLNCIIETHGGQHYRESNGWREIHIEQENDKLKERLAKENGITDYIVVDCRISDIEFIKKSILNSRINILFNLSKVEWGEIDRIACSNLVKKSCIIYNDVLDVKETSIKMKMDASTIIRYLKKGNELGWCNYDSNKKKEVIQLSLDGEFIRVWESALLAGKEFRISQSVISKACRGERKNVKGFKWIYKEDYHMLQLPEAKLIYT